MVRTLSPFLDLLCDVFMRKLELFGSIISSLEQPSLLSIRYSKGDCVIEKRKHAAATRLVCENLNTICRLYKDNVHFAVESPAMGFLIRATEVDGIPI